MIEFKKYLEGKVKIDKICDILVEDIKNNKKDIFLNKWDLFREKFTNIESLNITKVWLALIEYEKTEWFEVLPFNQSCHAVMYSARKYYIDNNIYNKKIFDKCYVEMLKISKSTVLKELETLKVYTVNTVHENNEQKIDNYLSVIMEIDELYRHQKPQNPDKFLTYIIITQGKEIEARNINEKINDHQFFKKVTVKLIEKLIKIDGIGANKLNNKKDSQSLNQLYNYFNKYYKYIKLDNKLVNKEKNDNLVKKIKI